MAKASETTTTIPGATLTGDTTGGGTGGKGPHPKRTLEIILLSIILILVAYNTYMISQDHRFIQNRQFSR